MTLQTYLNRLPIGGTVLAIIAAILSLVMAQSDSASTTVIWISDFLRTLSVVLIGVVFLGVMLLEALQRVSFADINVQDLQYIEETILNLRETTKTLVSQQTDTLTVAVTPIMSQLETLETMVASLEDLINDRT
jgi:hypothetical protein